MGYYDSHTMDFYFIDVKYLLLQMRIEVHLPNALAELCYCITEEW